MAGIDLQRVTKRYPDGTEGVKTLDLGINIGPYMRNSLVAAGVSTIIAVVSGASRATASHAAASAARTTSRSGSSPSGWPRSPR